MSSAPATAAKPSGARRSSKVCQRCHSRKSRCDVQHRHPCSTCAHLSEPCVLRRRKNAKLRSVSPPPLDETQTAPDRPQWPLDFPLDILPQAGLYVGGHNDANGGTPASNVNPNNAVYNFTALDDLEAIFNPPNPSNFRQSFAQISHENNVSRPDAERALVSLQPSHSLSLRHQDFLYARGCFTLPPSATLHQMMRSYVQYIHPNLPILNESELWLFWAGGDFSLGSFSLLLFRAILFSVSQFLTPDMLSTIGYSNTVEARIGFYTQAKLLFDFEQEIDSMIGAQACLLLTYFSPTQNTFQVNSYWLNNAARLAKMAGAHNHFLRPIETDRSRSLKKLWWGVLFRDTVLSLILRRTPVVEDLEQIQDEHILTVADFTKELGQSPVHERDTQLRLFDVIMSMCWLVRSLHPGLSLLYRYEELADRIQAMRNNIPSVLEDIESHLNKLNRWKNQTSRLFPSPITLDEDEVSGSVSIFANLLFCYQSSAVFAFNLLRLLMFEIAQNRVEGPVVKDTCEAMESAMDDFGSRFRELLQARLGRFLPITVSAMIAMPLVLQAINVTAARGIEPQEHVEARKLAVFQRVIEIQRLQFDGTDFIFETLSNVSAYAVKENLVPASESDRQSVDGSTLFGRGAASDWSRIAQFKPRPLLRLLFRLDRILCTGGLFVQDDVSLESPATADQGSGTASNGQPIIMTEEYIF